MSSNIMTTEISAQSLERLPVRIFSSDLTASREAAKIIADLIRSKHAAGKMAVLGLATGATPIGIYEELIRMHKNEGLSFQNVISFNLDEYYPMEKESKNSYHFFMRYYLFDHVDIQEANIHIPDGSLDLNDVVLFCKSYENKIKSVGGIDIQILGIGRTGHVGFNEPPSQKESLTRAVKLDPLTIADATREFVREELVPRRAITMGIDTILRAKRILLLAWGEKKASIIKETVEGQCSEKTPASFLQTHSNVETFIDENASLELTRIKTPWVVSVCNWNSALIKKAVIWLSQKLHKPILKLTDEDYKLNGLGDLLAYKDDSQDLNVEIFNSLQYTITGWPGGKPNADDTNRPERTLPTRKRVIIFSPHPDDDVISMGGTFLKLVEQHHEVHVAYQTSGNIAVFDDEALKYASFALDFLKHLDISNKTLEQAYSLITQALASKKQGDVDIEVVRNIKRLIRKREAIAGARSCGLKDEYIHFLNLPFYETGSVSKHKLSDADLSIVKDLLLLVKPHQIFAAGDLRDPHGTHRVCLDAIIKSIMELKNDNEQWLSDCYFWLYRGAWQEWSINEIEMAVPLSPANLFKKRQAIFKHQSQKDTPIFPGSDKREFWQRSEHRNRTTAREYDQLGLTEYEAIEAFVRYRF